MHSFDPAYLARLSFTTDQVAALSALGEARGRQELFVHQQPERLESLREVAVVESTESSNRIEGITAPRHRIEALVLKPTAPATAPSRRSPATATRSRSSTSRTPTCRSRSTCCCSSTGCCTATTTPQGSRASRAASR